MERSWKLIFIWGSILLSLRITHTVTPNQLAHRGRATLSQGSDSDAKQIANYNMESSTCTTIPLNDTPWWEVDLHVVHRITAVSIITKKGSEESLNGTEIRIGLMNNGSNQRCAIISSMAGKYEYGYQCDFKFARFVRVVRPGQLKILTLCGVNVLGVILENVAVRGVASQSSSRWRTEGKASSAIDGVRFTTYSKTKDEPDQWLKVDLLVPHNVTVIVLNFKIYCCMEPVVVKVDDTRCPYHSGDANLMTFFCGGIVGRNVIVMLADLQLAMAEIEIYSTQDVPGNTMSKYLPSHEHCSSDSCSRDYILIQSEPQTWFQAQTYCRDRYSDLATINSAQEMNYVIDKMQEKDILNVWIGLYEDVLTWRWSLSDEGYYQDGEAEFRKWADGEPRNQKGIRHCVGILDTSEWRDLDCGLLNYFLCFDGRDGASSRILVELSMTWAEAQQYCRRFYTDLLSVRNPAENQEIQSLVPAGTQVWIGLSADSWKWSDGGDSMFRLWEQGQPDSSEDGPNCAHVDGGIWTAKSCNTKSMFLCQSYKKKTVVKISANVDLSNPLIQQQIQKQLEEQMKNKGISDFKIRWRKSEKQVIHEEETAQCRSSPIGGETCPRRVA